MKLTGKCKEEFNEYYDEMRWNLDDMDFKNIPELLQNALIIDFFDSVGIYINIKSYQYLYDWSYEIKQLKRKTIVMEDNPKIPIKSRTQATNEAIIKANDLYNENN